MQELVAMEKPRESVPMDTASALARVDGDVELLHELVAVFLKDLPKMLTTLREAVMAGDASGIERAAHKFKGSVGSFAAQPAFEAALALEILGRDGSLAGRFNPTGGVRGIGLHVRFAPVFIQGPPLAHILRPKPAGVRRQASSRAVLYAKVANLGVVRLPV